MYRSVTLVCFHCKCEFSVDLIQIEARPERACPNCGQRFDFVGIGLLADGLRKLEDATKSVTFRLPESQELRQLRRAVAAVAASVKEPLARPHTQPQSSEPGLPEAGEPETTPAAHEASRQDAP